MEPQLLSVKESAVLLGVCEGTLRHWMQRRQIAYHKLNGRIFFRRDELELLIGPQSLVAAKADAAPLKPRNRAVQ